MWKILQFFILVIFTQPHVTANVIYKPDLLTYREKYFRNLLRYYNQFDKIFHVDNETYYQAMKFFNFGDDFTLQHMVYNHDLSGVLERPIGGNVLNVFFFKNVKKISTYIKDYSNISGRDILMVIIYNKTFNRELPADLHIKHAHGAGNILILNFNPEDIEFYHICTYCGSYENRVITVQKTNTSKVQVLPKLILPNSFRFFYGNRFTILFNQYFPFMHCLDYELTTHQNETFNKCLKWEGSEGMLLGVLSKTMNFTYQLITLTEYITIPKMLPYIDRSKKIDFAIGGIGLSVPRIKKLLFTQMINYENVVLMYKIHTGWRDRLFAFTNAFSMFFWCLLGFTSFVVSTALFCFLQILYKGRSRHIFLQFIQVPPRVMIEQPVISTSLTENIKTPVLIVLFCWMFGCILFNTLYKSSLSSEIIHPPVENYKNVYELLDKGYNIGIEKDKIPFFHFLLNIKDPEERKKVKRKVFNLTILCKGVPRVLKEKVAIAGEKSFLQHHCQTRCRHNYAYEVNYTPEPLSVMTHGWLFRKGAPFVESFNKKIRKMQSSGLMAKFLKDVLWQRKRFFKSDEQSNGRVALKEFTSHFTLYTIGITMSITAFLYEHIKYFIERRNKIKPYRNKSRQRKITNT